MRLGVSSSMGARSAQEWVDINKELGMRTVVFPIDSSNDDSVIDEYVKAARENDLTLAEVGIWRNSLSLDENEAKKNLEYSIKQLALADRIGARCAVNIAGTRMGDRWDGPHRDNFSKESFDSTVKMIRTVIDEVKPKNTYMTIEPMPWMIPTGPKEYLKLIDAVERDRFAVHLDIINMINSAERYFFNTEFLDETFELLGDKIKSCHLKDIVLLPGFTFQLKECACGEGTFNLEHYAELATKADPDMPMIIEHLKSDEAYRESVPYVTERLANWTR